MSRSNGARHPSRVSIKQQQFLNDGQTYSLRVAVPFVALLVSRLLAALYSPIQDCDEVFNFWEPTHYLNHGYGMQTWELSPEYSIRSWLYISLHALPIYLTSWMPFSTNKTAEFYSLRVLFAVLCSLCEIRVFSVIFRSINPRVAIIWLIIVVSSAGYFHSTTSYLSSSFAMYSVLLAIADFMDRNNGSRIAQGLTWLGVGTILGWPFVVVLCAPFVLEELYWIGVGMAEAKAMLARLSRGLGQSLLVLGIEIIVDSAFIRKLTCVPLNIVLYNVFSNSNKGPSIYGTEPWHFYIRNLLINFNLWFFLALLAYPLTGIRCLLFRSHDKAGLPFARSIIPTTPFYLWLTIFTVQPHKEERFMYPVYPLLAFNAAFSLHQLIVLLTTKLSYIKPSEQGSSLTAYFKLLALTSFLSTTAALGIWRSVGLATAYSAPLSIYQPLFQNATLSNLHPAAASPSQNLCLGKEWYRFPSSYHLPPTIRLKIIKSEFSGLLPGEFHESHSASNTSTSSRPSLRSLFPGAHIIPSGMNDENIEDLDKYSSVEDCDFLVDSSFPSMPPTQLEPDFVHDAESWEQITCEPFLDAAATGLLGRLVWVPDWSVVPQGLRRKWGEYCLLRKRK